ncbi:protein O-mannosyl-transferase TMTC4 [Uranotaenia lowii]|uniref:protein O-mannosyl-transferase TMTC4 n=1 Tax=Uranotaenia lowii TaxID=190385 RepID=UPI0024786864|nr:protein O-mannosyl-transferase TMTC4 [Uranotaenia lowii]
MVATSQPTLHPMVFQLLKYGILALLSFCCYYSSLEGTFVFDDSVAIVKNRDVTDANISLIQLFRHDFWGSNITDKDSHKSYRPLTIWSFRQEVHLLGGGQLNATRMKTTNWLLHTGIGLLLPSFFQAVGHRHRVERFGIEFWASVLFVIHPIHTEAVAGIVGRAELLATVWFVLAVLVYCSLFEDQKRVPAYTKQAIVLAAVFILTGIAVLCKETGVTILAMCAILDVLSNVDLRRPWSTLVNNKALIARLITLFQMSCLVIYIRLWVQGFTRPQFRDKDNQVAASHGMVKLLSQSYLYSLNLWLMLCPDWLSFDWALESIQLLKTGTDFRILFVLLFYTFLGLFVYRRRFHAQFLKALALMVVPFFPASGLIRVGFVIAERILYIPSLGFCYLIALGYSRLFRKYRRIAIAGLLLLSTIFILRTIQRASHWSTEHQLFRSALRVVPNNAKVYYNIARLATDQGDKQTAFEFYEHAIKLYPEYEAAHMNLGNLYREEQNYRLAMEHLRRAIELHEDFHTAWMNLGIVYAALKNHQDALTCYQRALKKQPHYPNCVFNLGNLYHDTGNLSMALATWNETIRQDPHHIKAWNNMINVYDTTNQQRDILALTARALQYLPGNPTLLAARATALAKMGQFSQAEQIYASLVQAHPRVEKYLQNMGVLYHRWGKLDQAERLYNEALKLNPTSEMAKTNLAKLRSSRHKRSN